MGFVDEILSDMLQRRKHGLMWNEIADASSDVLDTIDDVEADDDEMKTKTIMAEAMKEHLEEKYIIEKNFLETQREKYVYDDDDAQMQDLFPISLPDSDNEDK